MEKFVGDFSKITTRTGSLTFQPDLDVIVNAANEELRGGGGVCGAIFKEAGWRQMQDSCNEHPVLEVIEREIEREECEPVKSVTRIRCYTGGSKVTTAHNLPNKKVIHSVGPIFNKDPLYTDQMEEELRDAYLSALLLADELGMTSVGFPAISCGIFHYPLDQAAEIAVQAVQKYLAGPNKHLKEVRFVFLPFADGPTIQTEFEKALSAL